MPTISAIKPQKNKKRYNVFLDGVFAFGVDENTLIKEGLSVGHQYTPHEITDVISQAVVGKLVDKALRFLSYRPRSEKELRNYLARKVKADSAETDSGENQNTVLIDKAASQLKKLGQVNDGEFVAWWIDQRQRFSPRGERVIRQELMRKGVERECIDAAFNRIENDGSTSPTTESQWAYNLAVTKHKALLRSHKKPSQREMRNKISAHLLRRGFSWETVYEVMRKILDTQTA